MIGAIESVLAALNAANVRYLVVGDVAVVLHGHLRTTAAFDLVVQLTPDNALRAVRALATLGYASVRASELRPGRAGAAHRGRPIDRVSRRTGRGTMTEPPRDGYERRRREQVVLGLRLTPAERLRWLDETMAALRRWQGRARAPSGLPRRPR
jgi:hypothetical protein